MQEEQFIHIDKYGNTVYFKDKGLEIPHRLDGPAIECLDGHKSWYANGKRHRLDGPAVECADGYKAWWLHGQRLTEGEFIALTSPKPVLELTLNEIAEKFGICVDNLKIVK